MYGMATYYRPLLDRRGIFEYKKLWMYGKIYP